MDLSRNGLGPALADLSGCGGLVTLRAARNRFAGPLPLGALAGAAGTLRELDLSDNAFDGAGEAQGGIGSRGGLRSGSRDR